MLLGKCFLKTNLSNGHTYKICKTGIICLADILIIKMLDHGPLSTPSLQYTAESLNNGHLSVVSVTDITKVL